MADLTVEHLAKEYPTPAEPLRVLRDVSLQMDRGETLAILGPSGSGKSTLLQILGTLESPSSGSVRIGEQNPFTLSPDQLARFRSEQIGFVFQDHHLLPQLTAFENTIVPSLARPAGERSRIAERGLRLLDQVGLTDRIHHRPAELSGGERQRVAIARALLLKPRLLLADEPTGNLDRTTSAAITEILLGLQRSDESQAMLIVVTHSQSLADQLQRRQVLDAGQLRDA